MEFIKCNDCGKIYRAELDSCPKCGCPTEQQPKLPTIDESAPVDATKIFDIEEDKFEETKDITIYCREILSSSIDDLCHDLDIRSPRFFLSYHVEKGVGQLRVEYIEYELIKKIESIQDRNLADEYGSPCRRMIINIDDRENIKLELENNESVFKTDFPISQELFLKCCNAKKLEFKITKENGVSIIVNGYYGFDSETGAEINVNGDLMQENDLILNFQALYNYVIDPNMFTDAIRKRQMYDELIKRHNEKIEAEEKKELYDTLVHDKLEEENTTLLSGWTVAGTMMIVTGLIMSCSDFYNMGSVFVTGIVLLLVGVFSVVFGTDKNVGKK